MNAILSLAANYNFKQLKPLVASCRKSGYNDLFVLFIHHISKETIEALSSYNITTIPYNNAFPYFEKNSPYIQHLPFNIEQNLSPNSLRYILYYCYLKEHQTTLKYILHTDSRDVIFQDNPFNYIQQPGLYCFLEDKSFKIKDNKYNSFWIQHGFGDKIHNEMSNNNISCSGVTLGSTNDFLDYCLLQTTYINKIKNVGGMDQGIHNYLIHTNQIKNLHLFHDDDFIVTTLTTFKPYNKIKFNKEKKILNNKNQITPIVHQYDRHLRLLWRYNKNEFFLKVWNLFKKQLYQILKKS